MKPAPFEYVRPADLDEACAMFAAGDDTRIIAGGQTLARSLSPLGTRQHQSVTG
jgi:CO/xanthine dehydrogenase FAD-binding subunit